MSRRDRRVATGGAQGSEPCRERQTASWLGCSSKVASTFMAGGFLLAGDSARKRRVYNSPMDNNATQPPRLSTPALILGASILLAGLALGYGVTKVKDAGDSFAVTGSATERVQADLAKIQGSVSRTVPTSALADGYAAAARDAETVKAFAVKHGVKADEVSFLAPAAYEQNVYDSNGRVIGSNYVVSEQIVVSTPNVAAVTEIGRSFGDLAAQGVFFQSGGPEYYYAELAAERVKLLGAAIKDAKARAESIAASSGSTVGALRSATGGIVQVLAPNSTNVSDYGTYDTSTVEKEIMVTVRAEFSIK